MEINRNITETISANPEDIEAVNVMVKEIVKAVRGNVVNCDRTFKSVIKQVTPKGYVILDESGCERVVKCCIPNVSLKAGQMVWVKIPCGIIKNMHVCGVV